MEELASVEESSPWLAPRAEDTTIFAGPQQGIHKEAQLLSQASEEAIDFEPSEIARTVEEARGAPRGPSAADARRIPPLPPCEADLRALGKAFRHYKEHAGFAKGALLVATDGYLAPWAIAGFDATTERRLRVGVAAFDSALAAADGESRIAALESCFSAQDYASLDALCALPVGEGARLLMSGAATIDDDSGAAGILAPILSALGRLPADAAAGERSPRELLEKQGRRPGWISAAVLDLRPAVASIVEAEPSLDEARVARLGRRVVGAAFGSSSGECADLGGGRMLVVTHGSRAIDESMLLHRLRSLLAGYLPTPSLGLLRFDAFAVEQAPIDDSAPLLGALQLDA